MLIINRRNFLKSGSLAAATMLVPRFLKAFEGNSLVPKDKTLVIVQLSGGNDGLNTVIPYRNDIYYQLRPQLGIKRENALRLTDEQGLHPALSGLKALYDQGDLAVLNGVGYPNPDRSHFRSMDIWQSASDSDRFVSSGWVSRYLDAECDGCAKPTAAIEMDDTLSLAVKGERQRGLAFKDPSKLFAASHDPYFRSLASQHPETGGHDNVEYLYKTLADTISSADYLLKQSKIYKSQAEYPNVEFGRGLKTIAELIISNTNTRVYYISLGSFDTHVGQQQRQQRLLTQLGDGLNAFAGDLKKNGRFDDVMVMTFSEFGRRVAQNASAGTDHGTANCMFLLSGGLKKKGILNAPPQLTNLDQGDLKFKVDFKDVYATLLRQWLQADDRKVLGGKHTMLDFI